ncbi:MAG: hypothetical protein LBQ54_00425 [Planctomycetaceae bacterium]|jgi:hypothetical protein|nr:hypothetical protein [Planctomycetaceae bacterium]
MTHPISVRIGLMAVLFPLLPFGETFLCRAGETAPEDVVFQIGFADAKSAEFQKGIPWENLRGTASPIAHFTVGRDRARDWMPMHLSTRDLKNAGLSFTSEIEWAAHQTYEVPLFFVIGAAHTHPYEASRIKITVNGFPLEPKRSPPGRKDIGDRFNAQKDAGFFESVIFEVPPGKITEGGNLFTITLEDGSWIFYDYLALRLKNEPLPKETFDLKKQFLAKEMKDVGEILFVVRKPGKDPHWYANFSYYAADKDLFPFEPHGGASLNALDVATGHVRTVFQDEAGSIRDPQLHYDGRRILFSYLPANQRHYNLYEINLDGTGLKQITSGDWDDIEPTYTASGDIIFCSSRSKRWVQCWLTQVATLHRCGPNGENIREISANIEQDNTPWPLPNGQILYMRWEYVDRSQVHYHHLWTSNPDGTRAMVFYGNLEPGVVMLDAKPVEHDDKVVTIFSPGHGRTDHYGRITVVDPKFGPDNPKGATEISTHNDHADPWAFSEKAFLAARHSQLQLIDGDGREQTIYNLPAERKEKGYSIHEPRPVRRREREAVIADQTSDSEKTGKFALFDVYQGRKMESVKRGTIKELLVVETLPEPIHYSGGMDQISSGGTFTIERIYGTVPVTPEGSAFFELPAKRSFFFIALDHEGKSVKRMHSFTSAMPGEVTSCLGCHESRQETPTGKPQLMQLVNRTPVKPQPIAEIPDVFDFPRDIQPILDRHCVACHNNERTDAGINLVGDWGPLYTVSYLTLSWRNMFGDNRNRPESNFEPYTIGHQASTLYRLIEQQHQGAELSDREKKVVRYWLEAGANYAGTYAANGTGLIGWYYENANTRNDMNWPESIAMRDTIAKRCDRCHTQEKNLRLAHNLSEDGSRFNRHLIFNLTSPEKSKILLGPLRREAGGTGRCSEPVFADTNDPDYQTILAGIERGRRYILDESNRFSMPTFVANWPYTREMIRYGVLPRNHDAKNPIDPYEVDRRYWESLW